MEKGKLRNIFERIEIAPSPELEAAIFESLKARKRRKLFLWFLSLPVAGGLAGLLLFTPDAVKENQEEKKAMAVITEQAKARPDIPEGKNEKSPAGSLFHSRKMASAPRKEETNSKSAAASGERLFNEGNNPVPESRASGNPVQHEKHMTRFPINAEVLLNEPQQGRAAASESGKGIRENIGSIGENKPTEKNLPLVALGREPEQAGKTPEKMLQPDSAGIKTAMNLSGDSAKPSASVRQYKPEDSLSNRRQRKFTYEISIQAGYALLRNTERYANQTEIPAGTSSPRNGIYGSQFLAGIQGWILRESSLSFYLNCEAGIFSDYFRNQRYQASPGNYESRLENNVLVLSPRLQKIEEQVILKNLLLNAGAGMRYRFAEVAELRAGASLRTSPVSRISITSNGNTSRQNPGMQASVCMEAGLSAPLRSLPEKWGKFRLEIFYVQEKRAVWQLTGRDKTGYGFAGIKICKQITHEMSSSDRK
jgi:hypothetical protein